MQARLKKHNEGGFRIQRSTSHGKSVPQRLFVIEIVPALSRNTSSPTLDVYFPLATSIYCICLAGLLKGKKRAQSDTLTGPALIRKPSENTICSLRRQKSPQVPCITNKFYSWSALCIHSQKLLTQTPFMRLSRHALALRYPPRCRLSADMEVGRGTILLEHVLA
jgi:hypothetical protein